MYRIYCIPGLGVDHRLFSELKIRDAELIAVQWEIPAKNETMQSYARRLSRQIDTSDHYILMGVSFGGMLSVEMLEYLNPTHTFIVSSAKCRDELPISIRTLKHFPLFNLFSNDQHKKIAKKLLKLLGVNEPFKNLFLEMLNDSPEHYFKRAIACIANWDRKKGLENVTHIHGNKDLIIPINTIKNAVVIDGGTHTMILHHAKEISDIVNNRLSDC